tara:strand:- start:10215 stop:10589 length:375 start_codon:yes stop_codon:yes gene_type:complete
MTKARINPPRADGFHVLDAARVGLRAVGRACQTALQVMQTARMMHILSGFGDKQLAEIGIERCDIPSYAERLVSSIQAGDCDNVPVNGDISRSMIVNSPDAAIVSAPAIPPTAGDQGMAQDACR